MELREYQIEAFSKCVEFFKQAKSVPSLAVLPTGWGKSHLIAHIAANTEGGIVVLQPNKELLEQNHKKYSDIRDDSEIYSASFKSKKVGRVTFATIGSVKSLGAMFAEMGITKLIVDEVHHFPKNMESMLGTFLKDGGFAHVLGLTATPMKLQPCYDRWGNSATKLAMLTSHSQKNPSFFKDIIHITQVSELKDWWTPIVYDAKDMYSDYLRFNTTGSDYTDISVLKAYDATDSDTLILNALKRMPERKSVLVFVPSVEKARNLASKTPSSSCVYSGMPDKERSLSVAQFRSGEIRVMYNVNIFSLGADFPALDAIIMTRPTASFSWYYQALGRIVRKHISKTDGLVLDFSGNVLKFGEIESFEVRKETRAWQCYSGGKKITSIPFTEVGEEAAPAQTIDESVMPFGKYKGSDIQGCVKRDPAYFDWLVTLPDISPKLSKTINEYLTQTNSLVVN